MNDEMYASIIELIKRNRISTTEVADCLGKRGAIDNVRPICTGMYAVGKCRYIYGHSESNWAIHEQARRICPDEIVIIDGIKVANRAIAGSLLAKFILLYKSAAGIVALGNMRDASTLIRNRYAIWCTGFNPVGVFHNNAEETDEIREVAERHRDYYDNAIAVCDDGGVVIIPKDLVNEDFYKALVNVEKQEDIWFNCIDYRKWDTFDTVCLKKYLEEDVVSMKLSE